jgi:hypothetical protein
MSEIALLVQQIPPKANMANPQFHFTESRLDIEHRLEFHFHHVY